MYTVNMLSGRTSNSEDESEDEASEAERIARKSRRPLRSYPVSQNTYSGKKGWVLIIKNTDFGSSRSLPEGEEIETLDNIFEEYNYHVRVKKNVTATALMRHVKHYAEKPDSRCFVCIISSHGNLSSIECVKRKKRNRHRGDETSVQINDIFAAVNTQQLRNVPKVFLIDACRSGHYSAPPSLPDGNFIMGMSCLDKTVSWANNRIGDFYLHHVAEVFKESLPLGRQGGGYVRDIDYLLKKVSRDLSEYSSNQGCQQQSITWNTLHHQLFIQ